MMLLGLSASLFLLSGCGAAQEHGVTFSAPMTPGGRACVYQCQEAKDYCQSGCDLHQRACVGKVQTQAMIDYDTYVRQQITQHQPTDLHARDFERSGACDDAKKTCTGNCENNYRSCFEECGGVVEQTTSCQFLCF